MYGDTTTILEPVHHTVDAGLAWDLHSAAVATGWILIGLGTTIFILGVLVNFLRKK